MNENDSLSFEALAADLLKGVAPPTLHPATAYADGQPFSTGQLALSEDGLSGFVRPLDSCSEDTDPAVQYTLQTNCIENGAMTSIQDFRKCHAGPSVHYHFRIA